MSLTDGPFALHWAGPAPNPRPHPGAAATLSTFVEASIDDDPFSMKLNTVTKFRAHGDAVPDDTQVVRATLEGSFELTAIGDALEGIVNADIKVQNLGHVTVGHKVDGAKATLVRNVTGGETKMQLSMAVLPRLVRMSLTYAGDAETVGSSARPSRRRRRGKRRQKPRHRPTGWQASRHRGQGWAGSRCTAIRPRRLRAARRDSRQRVR